MEAHHLQMESRSAILQEFFESKDLIINDFHENPGSRRATKYYTTLIDKTIAQLYGSTIKQIPNHPKISIIAVGGYGRAEMFFHSDVDIMFLVEEGNHEQSKLLINAILYALWDMKLKVGHSVRTVSEALTESIDDIKTRTNLLEARRVKGSRTLADTFFSQFEQKVIVGREREFIEAKLEERAQRHRKFGDSRALLEPNVKEGKGGLRDLQLLMWLMRACYGAQKMGDILALGKISQGELRDFRRARRFLHIVRLHLHDIAGRAEERMTMETQRQIAERLGYRGSETANQSVERFMKRYFQVTRTVGQLTRTLCFLLEEEWGKQPRSGIKAIWKQQQLPDGLSIISNRLHFESLDRLVEEPWLMVEIFWYLHRLEIDIHPAAWQMITRNLKLINSGLRKNPKANSSFLQLLLDTNNPVPTLKRMNESGVLGKFIPDFGLLAGQMQFDLYHTYTVDEHILIAIGYLHQLEAGELADAVPLSSGLLAETSQRHVIYLALLCHDIAKGRGGNHHLKGVEIGRKLAKRFGYNKQEQQELAWLIEHHQHMSMVAFKRDLDDPQTIQDFADIVPSLEMLKILYAMTVADIHAVAPNIWNSWKGDLLEALYRKTERLMDKSLIENIEETATAIDLKQALEEKLPTVNPADIVTYIEAADSVSLEAYDIATHSRIFPCWYEVTQGEEFGIRFKTHEEQNMTQVTIATADRNGLFSQLAGVFAICGANIISARICTRDDNIVIDRFAIQNESGQVFAEERRQNKVRQRLRHVLAGELNIEKELLAAEQRYPSGSKIFETEPLISFDNESSQDYTLIEVQSIDRRGLLYRVTNALAEAGLSVSTAHIATYGEKVVDVFYVKDRQGDKLLDAQAKETLRQKLIDILR